MTYRVRENTRDIKGAPGHSGFKNYYVYCSGEFDDYYLAILFAVEYDKNHLVKCWVDCMDTYEFFDNEASWVLTNEGFMIP